MLLRFVVQLDQEIDQSESALGAGLKDSNTSLRDFHRRE
jgi:hypothetical protein